MIFLKKGLKVEWQRAAYGQEIPGKFTGRGVNLSDKITYYMYK